MTEIDREVVRRKLAVMLVNLDRLQAIEGLSLEAYRADWTRVKATERVLQEVVEAAVDVNQHLLAALGSGAAADYRQSFLEAGRLGIIPSQMAADLAPSAGLRHRLVHEYDEIDPRRVWEGLQAAVRDIPEYLRRVHEHLERIA